MKSDWVFLLLASVFEMAWPVGLKMAQGAGRAVIGTVVAVVGMALSGFFLFLAQRSIPLGTAYATWTGIGAAGTFCIGVALYGDPANLGRILGVFFIVLGVVTLKLS